MTPADIAALEPYRQWMSAFGGGGGAVQHIMANTAANRGRTVMSSSAAVQAKLNAVAPAIFPLPSTSWPGSISGGNLLAAWASGMDRAMSCVSTSFQLVRRYVERMRAHVTL